MAALNDFGWHAQEKEMLLQRMAALEEMLKLQKTQVYVLNIVGVPPLQAVQFQILYHFLGIIFGP